MRYASNSLAWFLHDTVVHPLTGALGLLGRALRSPRIMAVSHHLHNATAPSNDAWGDWAEAAHRAACNEGSPNESPGVWQCPCGARFESQESLDRIEKAIGKFNRSGSILLDGSPGNYCIPKHLIEGSTMQCPGSGLRIPNGDIVRVAALTAQITSELQLTRRRAELLKELVHPDVIDALAEALAKRMGGTKGT